MHRGLPNGKERLVHDEDDDDDDDDDDDGHSEQVEHLIQRLEAHQRRDEDPPKTPVTSSSTSNTPPNSKDFWKEMSPQLSYIDGSSVSSVGPPYENPLDWKHDPPERGGLPPLNSLNPLARHASDSLCTTRPVRPTGFPGNLSISNALELPGLVKILKKPQSVLKHGSCLKKAESGEMAPEDQSPQGTVVRVKKSDVKIKIQKRLSFGDTLALQTTIYTPAEDRDGFRRKTLANGSSNSLERGFSDDESYSGSGPPLVRRKSMESQSQYSYYMDKDLRYYFQHPWLRLIVAYLVIFCNFLLFAEDPVSHSHTESNIPVVGNVFSFVATKWPIEWYWRMIKVIMWLIAIVCGMVVGKVLIHGIFLKRLLRLKMFRDDQGSWMTMLLTVIVSLYMFSHVYNLILLIGHREYYVWQISSAMYLTNENMMKAAATCTWLGDLVTALMVTDMMLQDALYPHWAAPFRRLYRLSNVPRILLFWCGSIVVAIVVVFLIVSDYISWDQLNKGFVETTELSRAFLASFILVMDLLIMMQDWDFPHFTSTIDVNLPGFYTHTLHWRYAETKVTGKWFNYGIIFLVMLFDLNMWKNQIFYSPEIYGQYIDPGSRKVFTVEDESVILIGNSSLWTWDSRGIVDPATGVPYRDNDMFMYSRYMGYDLSVKCTAFIPSILGFVMLFLLVSLYGRFPPNQDGTYGGRLKRKRSSWRRERRRSAAAAAAADLSFRERNASFTSSSSGNAAASSAAAAAAAASAAALAAATTADSKCQKAVRMMKSMENSTDL